MTVMGRFAGGPVDGIGRPAGAGTYRFAIRAVMRDGSLGGIAYRNATLGAVIEGGAGTEGPQGPGGVGTEEIFTAYTEPVTVAHSHRPDNNWPYDIPGLSGFGTIFREANIQLRRTNDTFSGADIGVNNMNVDVPGQWSPFNDLGIC